MSAILVKTWTGNTFTLNVSDDCSTDDVFAAIEARGCEIDHCPLDTQLVRGGAFASYGISAGAALRLDSNGVDAMLARICAASTLGELEKLKPMRDAVLARCDAIAAALMDQWVLRRDASATAPIVAAPEPLEAGVALESFRLDAGEPNHEWSDEGIEPSIAFTSFSDDFIVPRVVHIEGIKQVPCEHHKRPVEMKEPQPIDYAVQVPCHKVTMVEKEIPKITPHLCEIAVVLDNGFDSPNGTDPDVLSIGMLYARGLALSSRPEWNDECALFLRSLETG